MHSVHTIRIGAPLPQHSLLSGHTWWGLHTWRAPSGNTVNDIHDSHKPSNRKSKVDVCRILAQDLPKLGPVLTAGTSYTISLHVFLRTRLRPSVGSMKLNSLKSKSSRGGCPLGPQHMKGGLAVPPFNTPACMFSGGCVPKTDQILGVFPQSCP